MTDSEKLDLIIDKLGTLENDIRNIKLTLDNEIRPNIRQIAEGQYN